MPALAPEGKVELAEVDSVALLVVEVVGVVTDLTIETDDETEDRLDVDEQPAVVGSGTLPEAQT